MDRILHYFPELSPEQQRQFGQLEALYKEWNEKINVISRKDIDELMIKHVLHSLGIAKVMSFQAGAEVLDIGTGGGFPGVPLAILFPQARFHLVDSIGKKIKVVQGVSQAVGLENLTAEHQRAEKVKGQFDFVVSRAVTQMSAFVPWTKGKFKKENRHALKNGILYLKGGDLSAEMKGFSNHKIYALADFFEEEFFTTKKVVHLPRH